MSAAKVGVEADEAKPFSADVRTRNSVNDGKTNLTIPRITGHGRRQARALVKIPSYCVWLADHRSSKKIFFR